MFSHIQHIAIIMDGNRRWAQQKGLKESEGYIQGVQSVKKTVRFCIENKISYLTLFTFSTENWKRSLKEVNFLFSLMDESLRQYKSLILSQKVRVHIVGDLSSLPEKVQKIFSKICEDTKQNKDFHLILAVNYGGRKEILNAVKHLIQSGQDVDTIQEKDFKNYLQSGSFPFPDLIIRTGGVQRLSNFYLWSAAYSELYFTDVMWPDFDSKELERALDYYNTVNRKFGGT